MWPVGEDDVSEMVEYARYAIGGNWSPLEVDVPGHDVDVGGRMRGSVVLPGPARFCRGPNLNR